MAEAGLYVYAVMRAPTADVGGVGLRGAPLRVVEHQGLAAVVSRVVLDEFGEEGLRVHLEDLAWLEEVARLHDDVVNRLAPLGPVAPLRLATICLDDVGVRARLGEWRAALVQALDRVDGRAEWSVKAYTMEVAHPSAAEADAKATAGSGAAYLRRKRSQAERRMAAESAAGELAARIHEACASRAVASRRLPPQDPRLTGHEGTMTLNGAYLVPFTDAAEFEEQVQTLLTDHPEVRIEVAGPWPPYSFATLEQA